MKALSTLMISFMLLFVLVAARPFTQGFFDIVPASPGPYTIDGGVSFDITTPPLKNYEYYAIALNCYQDGVLLYGRVVYQEFQMFLAGTDSGSGSNRWIGPADCVASLTIYTRPITNQQRELKDTYNLIIYGD